jgi:hypothetical protein
MTRRFSRRTFNMSACAALLTSPFARFAGPVRAAGPDTPEGVAKRLIVFFTPNGTIHQHWRPTGDGLNFDFPVGSIMESLNPYKDDLIVVDGIDFYGVANHEPGMAAMLTGGGGLNTQSQGRSLDQYIAAELATQTKFPSLELGVQTSAWGSNNQTRMCYSAPGIFVPPDDSPLSVYERMFGEVGATDEVKSKKLTRRQSILDIVRGELKTFEKLVSVEEKAKLQQHIASIEQIEGGLQEPVAQCGPPESILQVDTQKHENFKDITKTQIDLMCLALSCGMTNVASLQLSHTVGPHVFSWLGLNEGHHTLSHCADESPACVANYVKAERWLSEQFVYLLEKLKTTPEPGADGSMLDHTCLVWAQEMGDGRMHDCLSVPFVIAGKAGGYFETGRYQQVQNEPHQKLLVSICHAMGLQNPTFGDPSHGAGPLSGLGA